MEKKNRNSLLTGMIVGGAVGSVLSWFLSDKKRRNKAAKTSKDLWEKGKSNVEKFLEKYKKEDK